MPQIRWPGGWWRSLIAILVGNAIYFTSVPYLPIQLRHRPFELDWGLFLDLGICVAVYAASLALWPEKRRLSR